MLSLLVGAQRGQQMSEMQRYVVTQDARGNVHMDKYYTGEYVLWADHCDKIKRLHTLIARCVGEVHKISDGVVFDVELDRDIKKELYCEKTHGEPLSQEEVNALLGDGTDERETRDDDHSHIGKTDVDAGLSHARELAASCLIDHSQLMIMSVAQRNHAQRIEALELSKSAAINRIDTLQGRIYDLERSALALLDGLVKSHPQNAELYDDAVSILRDDDAIT